MALVVHRAKNMVHCDPSWNPSLEYLATSRRNRLPEMLIYISIPTTGQNTQTYISRCLSKTPCTHTHCFLHQMLGLGADIWQHYPLQLVILLFVIRTKNPLYRCIVNCRRCTARLYTVYCIPINCDFDFSGYTWKMVWKVMVET